MKILISFNLLLTIVLLNLGMCADISNLDYESIYLINKIQDKVAINYKPTTVAPESIERLAVDANFGKTIVGIPQLYDDGTHGDKVADDGTYSIEIKIPEGAKQVKLLFYVLDTDGNEVEIGPVVREIPSSTE